MVSRDLDSLINDREAAAVAAGVVVVSQLVYGALGAAKMAKVIGDILEDDSNNEHAE